MPSATAVFSEREKEDLHELYRIYDYSKISKVDRIVTDAEKASISPTAFFQDMYKLYKIKPLPDRDGVRERLHLAVPVATEEDVESAMRLTEMRGFAEADAIRLLERQYKIARTSRPPSRPAGVQPSVLPPIHGRLGASSPTRHDTTRVSPRPEAVTFTPERPRDDKTSAPRRPSLSRDSPKSTPSGGSRKSTPTPNELSKGNAVSGSQLASSAEVSTSRSLSTGAVINSGALPLFGGSDDKGRRKNGRSSQDGVKPQSRDHALSDSPDKLVTGAHASVDEHATDPGRPFSSHSQPSVLQDAISSLRPVSRGSNAVNYGNQRVGDVSGHINSSVSGTPAFRRSFASQQYIVGADGNKSILGDLNRSMSQMSIQFPKEAVDEMMAEEVREWVATMVGDKYNAEVLSQPNFVDALRNGVVLTVLLQKMEDPPVPDEKVKVPKRTTGFFARDSVAAFLTEARKRFHLLDAQMFNNSDLCDAKDDRQVVTCLMAMARIAYSQGTIRTAPSIVVLEREIEMRAAKLTQQELDRIVEEAEQRDMLEGGDESGSRTPATVTPPPATGSSSAEPEKAVTTTADTTTADEEGEDSHEEIDEEEEEEEEEGGDTAAASNEAASTADHDGQEEEEEDDGEESTAAASASTSEGSGNPFPDVSAIATEPAEDVESTGGETTDADIRQEQAEGSTAKPSPVRVAPLSAEESQEPKTGKSNPISPLNRKKNAAGKARDLPAVKATPAAEAPSSLQPEGEEEDVDAAGLVGKRREEWASRIEDDSHANEKPPRTEPPKHTPTRVVWKVPRSDGKGNHGQPPHYRSRKWDGIDVALGNILNCYYNEQPDTPWRFHAVAANAGEYVMYNRDTAQKKVIFVRFIQRRLFVRYSQKPTGPQWVLFADAVSHLDDMFTRLPK